MDARRLIASTSKMKRPRGVRVFVVLRASSFKSDKIRQARSIVVVPPGVFSWPRPLADAGNKRRTGEVHGRRSDWGPTWRHIMRSYRNDAPLGAIIDHVLPPFVGVAERGLLGKRIPASPVADPALRICGRIRGDRHCRRARDSRIPVP